MKDIITELFAVRAQIAEIEATQIKPLKVRKIELEGLVFGALEDNGTDAASIKGVGSVTRTESIVPQAEDWNAFYDWVLEDKIRFTLLNKALNAPAYREMVQIEGEVPGIASFTKHSLSVKKSA